MKMNNKEIIYIKFLINTTLHKHIFQINIQTIIKLFIRYPPCNVANLLEMKKETNKQEIQMMSFAQFRPEKDHMMQIRVFERVIERLSDQDKQKLNFVNQQIKIVGSVRNQDDEQLLQQLEEEVAKRQLRNKITFVKNPPYKEILKLLQSSDIGIHTMKEEHFGIAIVEMMAGGLITIAHSSGGPLKDIIQTEEYGFLCENEDQYVSAVIKAIQMTTDAKNQMIEKGRKKVQTFSEDMFYVQSAAHFENFLEYYKMI